MSPDTLGQKPFPRLCIGCQNLFVRCKECATPTHARVSATNAQLGPTYAARPGSSGGIINGVDERDIQRLEALRPALKREWEGLLRSEPAPSPLGNPDVLVYLMNETITRVIAGLRDRPLEHWTHHARALRTPLHRHCQCGFNPLLKYYATGEIALHVVVAQGIPEYQEEILTCYHMLAQKEIDTLCAVCQHRAPQEHAACKVRSTAMATPGEEQPAQL